MASTKKTQTTAEANNVAASETNGASAVEASAQAESRAAQQAQAATAEAAATTGLPEEMAVTNPAPATEMESPSGAFIEPEIKEAIPVDHPSVDNNPRAGTSAVQNGGDFNDPNRVHPQDPDFSGQGLDLSVYGKTEAGADQPNDK